MTRPLELDTPVTKTIHDTFVIHSAVQRALGLLGAAGRGHVGAAMILAGSCSRSAV